MEEGFVVFIEMEEFFEIWDRHFIVGVENTFVIDDFVFVEEG